MEKWIWKYFSLITKDYKTTMNTNIWTIFQTLKYEQYFFPFFILFYLFISYFFEFHMVSILVYNKYIFVFQYAVIKS